MKKYRKEICSDESRFLLLGTENGQERRFGSVSIFVGNESEGEGLTIRHQPSAGGQIKEKIRFSKKRFLLKKNLLDGSSLGEGSGFWERIAFLGDLGSVGGFVVVGESVSPNISVVTKDRDGAVVLLLRTRSSGSEGQ